MKYLRTVTFSSPQSTLTNFPVLVRLQNAPMGARISSSAGYDVCFEDLNGDPLPFELDFYDPKTRSGAWWVKIPTLSASASTTIRMLYGDPSITSDQSDPLSVWSDYAAVYHFNTLPETTLRNSATGLDSTCGFKSPSFATYSKGTGRVLNWTYSGSAADLSQGLLTTDVQMPSSDYAISMIAYDGSVPKSDIFMPLFAPNTGSAGSLESGNHVSYQWGTSKINLRSGIYPHNAELGGTVTHDIRHFSAILDAGTQRTLMLDGESNDGNKDEYSGREFHTVSEFVSFISFWDGTYKPAVDELRLRKTIVSNDWMKYEYENSIEHFTNTTYGDEMYSNGAPLEGFFPWICQPVTLD